MEPSRLDEIGFPWVELLGLDGVKVSRRVKDRSSTGSGRTLKSPKLYWREVTTDELVVWPRSGCAIVRTTTTAPNSNSVAKIRLKINGSNLIQSS